MLPINSNKILWNIKSCQSSQFKASEKSITQKTINLYAFSRCYSGAVGDFSFENDWATRMARADDRKAVSKFPRNIQQIGSTDSAGVDRYDLIYTQL